MMMTPSDADITQSLQTLSFFVNEQDPLNVKRCIRDMKKNEIFISDLLWEGHSNLLANIMRDAILLKNLPIVEILLKNKLNVHFKSENILFSDSSFYKKKSMVYFAVKVGNLDILKLVLQRADKCEKRPRFDKIALTSKDRIWKNTTDAFAEALVGNQHKVVEYLLKNRNTKYVNYISNPDWQKDRVLVYPFKIRLINRLIKKIPLLSYAYLKNQAEIFKALINHGVNIKKALMFNYEKICEIKKYISEYDERYKSHWVQYTEMTKIFLDHAVGIDFDDLDFLRGINLTSVKIAGLSLNGKVIKLSTLNKYALEDANHAIIRYSDIDLIKDQNRRKELTELFKVAIDANGLMITNDIINLVPLKVATKNNRKDVVELRLSCGVSPNQEIGDYSLIEFAAKNGFKEIVYMLARCPSIKRASLLSALRLCEFKRDKMKNDYERKEEIIDILSPYRKDINEQDKYGDTQLHYAIIDRDMQEIERLMKEGANLSIKNKNSETPMDQLLDVNEDVLKWDIKVSFDRYKVLGLFLKNSTTLNPKTYLSALYHTFKNGLVKHAARLLRHKNKYVSQNAKINNSKIWYEPFVRLAFYCFSDWDDYRWRELMMLLEKHGADFNKLIEINSNDDGFGKDCVLKSFLFNFSYNGHYFSYDLDDQDQQNSYIITKLSFLLDWRINPNVRDSRGNTPIHALVERRLFSLLDLDKIIKLYLKYGLDINAQNKEGNTPLHLAACGQPGLTQLFLDNGGSATVKNNEGQIPYVYSVLRGDLRSNDYDKESFKEAQSILLADD